MKIKKQSGQLIEPALIELERTELIWKMDSGNSFS
ncbi:hypothetical protein J2W97_003710 [Paenibacillus jamilae]|jgi:hypothetical protein|nr:hypothetical protein [Paenibacillus jamilae]SEJ37157.1 hypothetical protein SAMN04488600_102485 [Paenibacillus polymyxa]